METSPQTSPHVQIVLIVLLACGTITAGLAKGDGPPAARAPAPATAQPPIDRAFISFRISISQWMPENRYRDLLALFEKYKGVTDEITFFTSFTHPPIPADEMKRRC
jgi:hypothetical protein